MKLNFHPLSPASAVFASIIETHHLNQGSFTCIIESFAGSGDPSTTLSLQHLHNVAAIPCYNTVQLPWTANRISRLGLQNSKDYQYSDMWERILRTVLSRSCQGYPAVEYVDCKLPAPRLGKSLKLHSSSAMPRSSCAAAAHAQPQLL